MNFILRLWFQRLGLISFLTVTLLFGASPSLIWGKLPLNTKTEQVESIAEDETATQTIERLQQLQAKARQSLSSAQPVLDNTPPEQLGATIEEVNEKQFLLFTRVFLYGSHIESLRSLEETRLASDDLSAKSEAWQGFDQEPPYPISLVDELRDAIHAQTLAITNNEVRKALTLQEQDEARKNLIVTEKILRKVKESLEKITDGDAQVRSNWLDDLARLKNEVAEINVLSSKAKMRAIDASITLYSKQKTFHERQLQVAVSDAPFTKKELDQNLSLLTKKIKALEKEKRQTIKNNNRNQEKLHKIRSSLQEVRDSLANQESDKDQIEEIHNLQQIVETRKVQADASAEKVELLKIWIMGMKGEMLFWEERYRLVNNRDETELQKAFDSLKKRLEKINEHRTYIESNLTLSQNLILNEEQRLNASTLSKKERSLVQQKLSTYEKQSVVTRKLLIYINDLTRNAQRFQDEVNYYRQQVSAGERLQEFFNRSFELIAVIWNYELFVVEDTISVDGQSVTAQRPVTISKMVRALMILVIGFWVTILLKHRLSGVVSKIFKVEANAALLVEKFLLTGTIFTLLIISLITVKIPLTAFAFMGGALAIGVGFGAQALINNFISGIILLFEGPIKVGDRIEVEGTKGRVVSIGLRCSQVRRYDGVDILVPNSDFLQKSVVNWTLTDQLIRLKVTLGVAYGSPTREVSHIIEHALSEHGKILKTPEPIILFEDFGDSALIFGVYFWVEVQESFDYRIIASDLRHMLDRRLDEANIDIAFPQLDVHLDSNNFKTDTMKVTS
jgi:potassium-dependent mechanosensitive channel